MAIPVARVHLAMTHAALPGLLPVPPERKTPPLLPTPPCAAVANLVILLNQSPSKHSRADSVDRWDACKSTLIKSPPKATSRADAVDRWDACKSAIIKSPPKATSRADGAERWDMNKKSPSVTSSSSSSSSGSSSLTNRAAATSSCAKWERTKRPVSRGSSSSDERWDAHKKPRLLMQASGRDVDEVDDQSSTGSNYMEVDDEPQPQTGHFYGQGFPDPPEPRMLPTPSLLILPRSGLV